MHLIDYVKLLLPFGLGLAIGAGFTRNKYFFVILVSYIVFMVLLNLVASRISKTKKKVDDKALLRKLASEGYEESLKYTEFGMVSVWGLFDRWYPVYVFFVGIASLTLFIYFLVVAEWLYAVIAFVIANFFIIQNQIWRKVKNYDNCGTA